MSARWYLEGREGVGGLSRLRDREHDVLREQDRVPVTELGRVLDLRATAGSRGGNGRGRGQEHSAAGLL